MKMKMKIFKLFLLSITLLPFSVVAQKTQKNNVDNVDPTIGGASALLQPTRQTIQLPNQMLRFMPLRADMLDDWISDYSLLMASHRLIWCFGFMPFNSSKVNDIWNTKSESDCETTKPYYYKTILDGILFEFAPSNKSGIIRMTFSNDAEPTFRFRSINEEGTYDLTSKREISGQAKFNGMSAYIYAEFDTDLNNPRFNDNKRNLIVSALYGTNKVIMRYGISYISVEQAKKNLNNEIPIFDFEHIAKKGCDIWESRLAQIKVEGGTESHRRTFYTALYRCSERMVDVNEYGRYFSAYDHKIHESGKPFYVDNWIWDTHIALEPLQTILNPQMETDKINSYIEMYKQCGTMPSFATTFGDWPAMTGNYTAVWMADAWNKGLRFDIKTAYEGLKKNSLESTLLPWRNGPKNAIDDFYNSNGYYPSLHNGEKEYIAEVDTAWERRQAVSITTAFSYADWCTAKIAKILKYNDDADLFMKRAANYKNVFRVEKGFMWPKDKDGKWIEPFDPRYGGRAYFTENNAYIFNWDVKHDLTGLFVLMGGRKNAENKLDNLFHEDIGMAKYNFFHILPDATGLVGEFQMGNEPSFHIPYIYDYLGAPWKTQKRIHNLVDAFYFDGLFGMPGDEDGGGMSAFVVFSMVGFFPVTPGIPVYAIGSPFFENATIQLPSGNTFVVKAVNYKEGNKYIKNAILNGNPLQKPWFSHEELMKGGTLELIMSDTPNKSWGTKEDDAPPSSIDY
jgi:predicted alpha-1,2-mannosidase